MRSPVERRLPVQVDLLPSLSKVRQGRRDPTVHVDGSRFWRATRTPAGVATLCLDASEPGVIVARAWGPGAQAALEAAPALCGAHDCLEGWDPARHPKVREFARCMPGLRMVSTGAVLEAAVAAVLGQKVQAVEAHTAWRRLLWAWGEDAPGPVRLKAPPPPQLLAAQPYHAYHRLGIERRRADTIRRLAARAVRVEEAASLPREAARARLEAFPGVGPWTSAEVAAVAWGDADAVSVGDYNLPGHVVYVLTGKRGGDDDAMLDLLEPFRPHRARAARLITLAGPTPARRAPRARVRDFRRL